MRRAKEGRRGGFGRSSSAAVVVLVAAGAAALLGGVAAEEPEARAVSWTEVGISHQLRFRETGDPALLSRSEAALRRALRAGEDEAGATGALASLAATRHRFAEAERLAKRTLRLAPDSASAHGTLGDALVELGRYEEAFAAFDRMAELAPSVGSYARVAQARELQGRRAGALEALELSLELSRYRPGDRAYALTRIGRLHQDGGRLAEAEHAYRAALRVQSGFPHAAAGLALVAADRGELRTAATGLRRVLERLPSSEYAVDLGDLLVRLGREEDAAPWYALAHRLERRLAAHGVDTRLQSALFDLDHDRDLARALARARAGREARPGIEGDHVLAWALYKNGRCREARAHSIRALRLGTPDLDALYHRSLIELCLGNTSAAERFLARVRTLNPAYLAAPPSSVRLEA
jgi:tetratricopeptide (TPR) repeat protein